MASEILCKNNSDQRLKIRLQAKELEMKKGDEIKGNVY